MAAPVIQHRIVLDYSARLEGRGAAAIVAALLAEVPMQERAVPSTLQAAKL